MTTSAKTCFKCGAEKPLTEFYRHPQMADGHLNKCKSCAKRDVIQNRLKNIEHYREYEQRRAALPQRAEARSQYQKSERGREACNLAKRRYRERNPIKTRAQIALKNAVRDGRILKSPCCTAPGCFSQDRVHGHHTHYDNPLSVVWLCTPCHARLHRDFNRKTKASPKTKKSDAGAAGQGAKNVLS